MAGRSRDWLRQAERDLETAGVLLEQGRYEWSCFVAQQSAEKAAVAAVQQWDGVGWGGSVSRMLTMLAERTEVSKFLLHFGKTLDKYQVPTRYPDSFGRGSPYQYYTARDAIRAVTYGRSIVEFCAGLLA
ncbi:MAG: HEPN domain-containing protein [Chloroflexota bacterium]|jgi:HEPN domain-containing protein